MPSSGVSDASGVIAPFSPTSSPRTQTASALSTAVELAFCTISQSRCAPEISTSNGAGAVIDCGGVAARAPRELIGATKSADGGGRQFAQHRSRAAKQPIRQPLSVDELERLNRGRRFAPGGEDLVANRPAERACQRTRRRSPFARVASWLRTCGIAGRGRLVARSSRP